MDTEIIGTPGTPYDKPCPVAGPVSREFLLAGHAIFTVANPSGDRFTFKVERKDQEPGDARPPAYFAHVLAGPDNTRDYRYLGMLWVEQGPRTLTHLRITRGSRANGYNEATPAFRVCNWAIQVVYYGGYNLGWNDNGYATVRKYGLPSGYSIQHAGYCGRCGRLLTVPESIERGIGPDCAAMMGL